MQVINRSKDRVVAKTVHVADTFRSRLKGLLGRKDFPPGEGLVLHPCSSVHTCFMKFPIDVVFLDRQGRVVYLQENLIPWRFTPIVRKAATVVELPPGSIEAGCIKSGDTLILVGGVLNV